MLRSFRSFRSALLIAVPLRERLTFEVVRVHLRCARHEMEHTITARAVDMGEHRLLRAVDMHTTRRAVHPRCSVELATTVHASAHARSPSPRSRLRSERA